MCQGSATGLERKTALIAMELGLTGLAVAQLRALLRQGQIHPPEILHLADYYLHQARVLWRKGQNLILGVDSDAN